MHAIRLACVFCAMLALSCVCGSHYGAQAMNADSQARASESPPPVVTAVEPPSPPFGGGAPSPGVLVRAGDNAVDVIVNGELFTRYVFAGAAKPYCWPLIGPTGTPVTRAYPMETVAGEAEDHPHQKSMWFTHGDVNDVDFWGEGEESGTQVHRGFEILESGALFGAIRARNDWLGPDGKKICEDVRELRFYNVPGVRLFDFEITVLATEGPVTFGDTKEGTFGFRVAQTMTVDGGQGHIENARGNRDADTWGKAAEWCDYYGPVEGETVGIAVMDHPQNLRHPTYWHVRTYGLFAANPFGLSYFVGEGNDGAYAVPAGGSLTLRYRVMIHRGSTAEAGVAQAYAAYTQPPAITLSPSP